MTTYDALLTFKERCPCACSCAGDDEQPDKRCPTSCGPHEDRTSVAKWLLNEKYRGDNKVP